MRVSYKLTLTLSAVFLMAFLSVSATAGTFTSFLGASQSAPLAALTSVPGSVPVVIQNATAVGSPASSTQVSFTVFLPMRNQATFKSTLSDIYNKSSPLFHHFLTPAQIAAQFSPTTSDYQALQSYFTSYNLQVTYSSSDRMLMGVSGSISDVSKALSTTFSTFQKDGVTFFANTQPVQLPTTLNVAAIFGLSNYTYFQPMYTGLTQLSTGGASPTLISTGNVGAVYYAQQIQEAYGATPIYAGGNTGNGTNIA
ncbi:MAG TPA: protease pro-enzyme activation domain-containing protein, partial [Conexivisphaerales archaeon]|nr:protease pro-enzyme activation domain-containing protein [Conexivisphaerales archaeon]